MAVLHHVAALSVVRRWSGLRARPIGRRGRVAAVLAALAVGPAAFFVVAAVVGFSRSPVGHAGPVLYMPDLAKYPTASANYTWTVRLAHNGAANGRMIAAHDNGLNYGTDGSSEPLGIRLYRSDDDGLTWSDLSVATDAVHGWQMFEPALLELPVQIGDGPTILPAGTLLLSGLALGPAPRSMPSPFGAELEVYSSADQGATWRYLSACDAIPATIKVFGAGMWEPTLALDNSNHLACFFSDERFGGSTGGPGDTGHYSQTISHRVSRDAGRSWGEEVFDVAVGGGQRPGMPQVVRLPNGTFLMVYEVCGQPDCQVRERTSPDGTSWGAASDLGTVIEATGSSQLGHTPYVTWSPTGGPNGTLFVSAMHVNNSFGTRAPENGKVLFVNAKLGVGPWTETPAPLAVVPGTGPCAGWRQALEVSVSGTSILQMAPSALNHGTKCEIRFATGEIRP